MKPASTCSATITGAHGRSRQCRLRAPDGLYCHRHGGNASPPTEPCTTCWSRSWEPVAPDMPGAVPYHGGHIRCALCHVTDRANTASTIIREALSAAERGAMDEVVRLLRSAQPDA